MLVRVAIACAAAGAALAGCGNLGSLGPGGSMDSIYLDTSRAGDPAVDDPHLSSGPPRAHEVALASGSADPFARTGPEQVAPPPPAYQTADVVAQPLGFRLWIDGHEPSLTIGARSGRVGWHIATTPTVRFELADRLGAFRSITVQVYRVINDKLDPASGVRITETDRHVAMVPGKPFKLPPDPASPGVTIRSTVGGESGDTFPLRPDSDYEFQFVIGGNQGADALCVRIHTLGAAPPPSDSQPQPPSPGPQLPPGVTIP